MKKLLTAYFFLLSIGIHAQGVNDKDLKPLDNNHQSADIKNTKAGDYSLATKDNIVYTGSTKAAKRNNIRSRKFKNLKGVNKGYYVIANVFKDKDNLAKNINKLQDKGLNANYILNAKNGLNYLYLERFDTRNDALDACKTNFNGAYYENMWIMIVDNGGDTDKSYVNNTKEKSSQYNVPVQDKVEKTVNSQGQDKISIDEVTYDMLDTLKEDGNGIKEKESPSQNKLIQKADQYFDKMWYAEAAELYEEALSKDKGNYSYDILQKAGDAHYFNTNMEKAYHWYNILYENYKKDMSADNIFKYAHSLKGTGKYARAKRLMRLYDKKLKKEDIDMGTGPTPKEMVLDKILGKQENFAVKNLAINSEYSDFSPMFLNENKVVFASAKDSSFFHTRRYKWNNQPYLDLYVAKMNEESQELKGAIKFSKKINTKYHEAAVTFSPDNTTMYFTRNNYVKKLRRDKNGINHLKIYMSTKVDGEWTEAVGLPFNSDDYSTGHPALSKDGKQLYFVSDMPGSLGETDIFVVDVLGNGNFSEPRNLGPGINTEQKEMFPFINDKKLYFSSNGHIGLGGLDVYEVAFNEEGFQEVKNVGKPVNSEMDDFSYIVNEETQKGYFASNRKGGKGDDDIYSFKRLMVEEVKENLNAIAGVVTELMTGDVMPEALVMLLDENNIKLKEVVTSDDGSFVFEDLEGNTKYTLKTVKGDYFDEEQMVATKENEVVNVDVSMKKLKELIVLEDGIKKLKTEMIYFNFDKFNIRTDAAKELDKVVDVMNEYKDMVIKIESHTDARGNNVYNKYLSDKRAKSTRDYLVSRGIDAKRIESAVGYGEERLINECGDGVRCSKEKHELNRRSEIIIVKM